MKNENYNDVVVSKPWGHEYLCFANETVAIWLLNIKKNASTSMHCHPNKKTGFIVVNGEANIQLGLWKKDTYKFKAPSKLMIRTGLFHSIKSKSKPYLVALEF